MMIVLYVAAAALVLALVVWGYVRSSKRAKQWRRDHPDHRPQVDPGSDYSTYGDSKQGWV